jgi:hypothetical protein
VSTEVDFWNSVELGIFSDFLLRNSTEFSVQNSAEFRGIPWNSERNTITTVLYIEINSEKCAILCLHSWISLFMVDVHIHKHENRHGCVLYMDMKIDKSMKMDIDMGEDMETEPRTWKHG